MIIRPSATSTLLITQPDHAALAARIMQHWRADGLPESPRSGSILLAIAEHDNGWREVDATPIVDSATGELLDFIHAPDEVRRSVWPRGIDRLAATPYAAGLVAAHALHIYRRYRSNAEWAPFFTSIEALRDRHLAREPSATLDDLLRDYRFVRAGDLASLAFCNGWTDDQTDASGYIIRMDEERLLVTPDPFAGLELPIEIAARKLPQRSFESADDAARAYQSAPIVTVSGSVCGGS
jgi:hypothetical protein